MNKLKLKIQRKIPEVSIITLFGAYGKSNQLKFVFYYVSLSFLLSLLGFSIKSQAALLPDFTDMVKTASDAVVNISTVQIETDNEAGSRPRLSVSPKTSKSLGSGFIISTDGYILTNRHVIQNADEIRVKFKDRRELIATMIGSDQATDVALLKVNANNLPMANVGSLENLKVGEWVVAIGSPFGFDQSVTAGIVSAKDRVIAGTYTTFIQTDVAINRGNSGGPLFNLDGKVVGINSWIFSQSGSYMGLSFAIPMDVVMNVVDQIRTQGKVVRGWIGVQTQEVSQDLAQSFGMDRPYGALISEISFGSPAAKSGLTVGDVVIAFNGHPVETAGELAPKIGMMPIGTKVQFEIIRQGEHKTVELKLGILPEVKNQNNNESSIKIVNRLGIVVGNLTLEDRQILAVDTEAIMVRAINTGTAFKAGVQQGDVILNLNNRVIHNTADIDPILNAITPGTTVAILIQRKGKRFFLPIKLN